MISDQNFLSFVQKGDVNELYNYLRDSEVKPHLIQNEKGYTGLHLAALNNHPFLIQVLIRFVKDTFPEEKESILPAWIEAKTVDEEFTCLHFAVFRGNIKIARMLIEQGADLNAVNKQGLNVMHLAAQGDQALLLTTFKERYGMGYETLDAKDGTPLHWAAYLGSEAATSVMLSWQPAINTKDRDGQTPLHLATISYNARIVRLLLLKGAERGIIDNRGKTAMHIAKEQSADDIAKMLLPPSPLALFGIKNALKPFKNYYVSVIIFLFFFVGGNLISILFILPDTHLPLTVLFLLTLTIASFFWLWASCKDPGYLSSTGPTLLDLLEKHDSASVCPDCVIFRPARSRHCQWCNRCVLKFDHHCPWVNNWIGAKNLGVFYLFLFFMDVHLVIGVVVCLAYLSGYNSNSYTAVYPSAGEGAAAAMLSACVVFLLGVTGLFVIQSQNFYRNVTTNERFSRAGRSPEITTEMTEGSMISTAKLDRTNPSKNFRAMCCNAPDGSDDFPDILLPQYSGVPRRNSESDRYTLVKQTYEEKKAKEMETPFLE